MRTEEEEREFAERVAQAVRARGATAAVEWAGIGLPSVVIGGTPEAAWWCGHVESPVWVGALIPRDSETGDPLRDFETDVAAEEADPEAVARALLRAIAVERDVPDCPPEYVDAAVAEFSAELRPGRRPSTC